MSDFKPNAILDGLTREQALACVLIRHDDEDEQWFSINGKLYPWCKDIGLSGEQRANFIAQINAYFDTKEAAEKWVEPEPEAVTSAYGSRERFYKGVGISAEVDRTNARRKIEAFIAANGGSGRYEIRWLIASARFDVNHMPENVIWPGLICCISPELAAQIILRYPDELRLLCGASK